MSNIRINTSFRNMRTWKDSARRSDHVIDRMKDRGIGLSQIKAAISKGSKRIRKDGSIVSDFRWFRVIYREFRLKDIRKIYPITVIEV